MQHKQQQQATKTPAGKQGQKKDSKKPSKGLSFAEQLYAKYEGKVINQLSASMIEAELQRIEKQVSTRGEASAGQKNAIALLKHYLNQTEGHYRGPRRQTKPPIQKAREHIVQEQKIAAPEAARTPTRRKAEKPVEDLESLTKYFGDMTIDQLKLEITKRDNICTDLPKHSEVRRACGREITRLHRFIALLRERDGITTPSRKERLAMRIRAKIEARTGEEAPAPDESFCLQAEESTESAVEEVILTPETAEVVISAIHLPHPVDTAPNPL